MKLAVIGAGWWGRNIINSLLELPEVTELFVFDSNEIIYSYLKSSEKIKIAASFEEILNNSSIEAVCISTPPQTHFEYSKLSLQHNKHVLTEKPPAYSLEDVQELGALANEKGLVYMLDALYLFLEPIRKIKEMIDSGEFSHIKYVQLFRQGDELRRKGSGLKRLTETMFKNNTDIIEDLFFHDAGILQFLFGDIELVSVEKLFIFHPTICDSARLVFNKGIVPIEVNLSWSLSVRKRGVVIYDSNYILEYDAFAIEKQISKYNIHTMEEQFYTFENSPPLKNMLVFFLESFSNRNTNFLDVSFMKKIIKLWSEIKDEKSK